MIVFKNIKFSNILSYGADNEFAIDNRVTQLVGANGHGKSSIPVILEEGVYNKNSRGLKKGELFNRYVENKSYSIQVDFCTTVDDYRIIKTVASSAKVKLIKNGEDISGHTATQTYKIIEEIIGLDFSTFTRLVYQSMVSSLDFLSATDANRKKFLVSLLGLEKYVETESILKEEVKATKNSVASIQGGIATIEKWLKENSAIPEVGQPIEVPEVDPNLEDTIARNKAESANIVLHNSTAKSNKQAKDRLDLLRNNPKDAAIDNRDILDNATTSLDTHKQMVTETRTKHNAAILKVNQINAIKEKCHECGSPLDVGNKAEMLELAKVGVRALEEELATKQEALQLAEKIATETRQEYNKFLEFKKYETDVLQAEQAYDSTKPTEVLDSIKIKNTITQLETELRTTKTNIQKAIDHNNSLVARNARIEMQKEQLESFKLQLDERTMELKEAKVLQQRLETLAESLGNKGLISYKIESSVKVFEELINQYLQVLSDGQFALGFAVEGTKLALNLYSDGVEVDIKSLSSGEFNKVNTATLLAIRKMLSAISKVDINLLFLDEVVSVLDQEGKDTLIEVLLREQDLNSIVVSHGYAHPLADKINVIKENKISRLEHES